MRAHLSALIASLACFAMPASAASERPNVLFIAIDDLNMNVGCYGNTIAKTPNIDRLAARGVRFDRAYCQYPLCNPSRASMLTGLRPDTLAVYDLKTNLRSTAPDVVTLPQLFRNHGYFVARVGKIYHYGVPREIGTDGMDDPPSWDYRFNPLGRDKIEEEKLHVLTRGTGSTLGFAMAWLDMKGTDAEQTDGIGTAHAIELLERHRERHGDKPFFIGMGYFRPHTPFVATKPWFEEYPVESIKLPDVPADDLKDIPDIALTIDPPDYGLSEKDLKDCVRAYIASVAALDAMVGQLLDALDRLKLAESTIVVLFSDHGFLLGEHHQWQKQMLFEPAARVPLLIAGPGVKSEGGVAPKPVELLDVYPTLAEMCGLAPPGNLEGSSLKPLLDDPSIEWDRPAITQVTRRRNKQLLMGYSVRTQRWRYIQWSKEGREGEELYDHENDPGEIHNLASDPSQADRIAQMRKVVEPHRAKFLENLAKERRSAATKPVAAHLQ